MTMIRKHRLSVRLVAWLILANGSSLILGFQTLSKTKRGSIRSKFERKWYAKTSSSSSLLRGHDDGYPENESFLSRGDVVRTGVRDLERGDCGPLETFDEDCEDTYGLSSRLSLSNFLEYKEQREVTGTNNTFIDDEKASKRTLASMDEMYKLKKDEMYKLLAKKNLPKKKPISFHSFISSMSAMAALVLLLPTFHPGIDDLGLPRLFSYEHASIDLLWQSQLVALLQLVSSILGVFRLPKNSPNVRIAGFLVSALIVTQLSLVTMSSLNGTDVYLFDAFSLQGRIIISTINTALVIGSFDSLALIVRDKEKKGWETVPGYGSRPAAFLGVFPFHVMICVTGNAVLPVLCDKQSFLENALPFFEVFPGVQTLGYVAISLSVGLGALLATLQFENKITSGVASFWNIAVIAFFTYDSVKFMYLLGAFPERFPHSEYFVSYTPHLQSLWHTNEVLTIGTILAMAIGLRDLSEAKKLEWQKNRSGEEARALLVGAPSAADEPLSPFTSDGNFLPSQTLDSKKYEDIHDTEERAYQVVIDLERIEHNSNVRQEDTNESANE